MNIVAVNVANVQQKDNVIREVFNNILDNVSNKHDQCNDGMRMIRWNYWIRPSSIQSGKAFCCWKQVELNTIASGFGWLGPASGMIHRLVDPLYQFTSIVNQVKKYVPIFSSLIFDIIFLVLVLGKSSMFIDHLGWCIMLWKKYNMRLMLRSHKAETLKKCLMTLDNAWGCLMMTLDDIKLHSIMDRKTDGQ